MGLTEDQKIKREVATQGITTFDAVGEDDYVFISYKSDDWEIVLDKVVRYMVENYGLRVYFDKNFDRDNDSWVKNMRNAITTRKCRAVLAFVSKKYMVSYACLMELLTARSKLAQMNFDKDNRKKLPIIPIIIDHSGSVQGAMSKSGKPVSVKEWKEYVDLLKNTKASPWIDENEDLKSWLDPMIDGLELTEERISIVAESILREGHERTFTENSFGTSFFNNLREAIGKCSEDVFDPSLIKKKTTTADADAASGESVKKSTVNTEEKAVCESGTEKEDRLTGRNEISRDYAEKKGLNARFTIPPEPVSASNRDDSPVPDPLGSHKADSASLNLPETIPNLVPGCMKKWIYRTRKGANAVILWDGTSKNCKVLKGSIAAKEAPNFATSALAAKKLKDLIVSQGKLSGLEFTADYDCDRISTMINLLNGGSVSMPAEINGKNLRLVEDDVNSADMVSLEAGTGSQEPLSREPVPSVETAGSLSGQCIYTYKNARIQCDINSNVCTVLMGSKTQGESPKFATNAVGAKKLKDELKQERIIENDVFLEDYTGSMATLLNLINGGSVSSTREKEKFVRES